MPTYAELSAADPTRWLHRARGWERLGHDLAAASDRLGSAFAPLGRSSWAGADADAARERRDRARDDLHRAAERGAAAADVLGRHAGAVLAAQKRLRDAVLAANPLTTRVTADGLVVPRWSAAATAFWSLPAVLAGYLCDVQRVGGEIAAAVEDAARSDREAADALRAMLPPAAGTGSGGAAEAFPDPGTAPAAVRTWWEGLATAARVRLTAEYPERVGALDGVPVADRDRANRIRLDAERVRLERRRWERPDDGAERARLDRLLSGIGAVERRLGVADPPAFLLGFDTEGAGHAIVAAGDPDRADHVVTLVPGTTASLGTVGVDLHRSDATLAAARAADPRAAVAAVTWIGYDAPPDLVRAVGTGPAERAAEPLARFDAGLRATHAGAPAHHTVVGHSYGSTVVGYAARTAGLRSDETVFVGSPGTGAATARDLGLDPAHVWATVARRDPIAEFARTDLVGTSAPLTHGNRLVHGTDPTDHAFGARVFTSAPGSPLPRSDDPLTPHDESTMVAAHAQYWDDGTPSWTALGRITVGRRDVG